MSEEKPDQYEPRDTRLPRERGLSPLLSRRLFLAAGDATPEIHSLPHQCNGANFHSHGRHVSPSGISDNVLRIMEPGKSYDIEIAIPADHVRGTNWYPPHAHGSAGVQIASGVAGAL